MKAKKVVERIFKVINILVNMIMGWIMIGNAIGFGTSRTIYSDDMNRLVWLFWGIVMMNVVDYFVRKRIREF